MGVLLASRMRPVRGVIGGRVGSGDLFGAFPFIGNIVVTSKEDLCLLFFVEQHDDERRDRTKEEASQEPTETAAILRLCEPRIDQR